MNITASLQIKNIDKTAPTVTLSTNGGTYTIPTGGTKATIKTTLKKIKDPKTRKILTWKIVMMIIQIAMEKQRKNINNNNNY